MMPKPGSPQRAASARLGVGEELVEGTDYYMENGFMVFTAVYLRRRGFCCESGCRHCPYGFVLERHEKRNSP